MNHPRTELIPHVRGELSGEARERVSAHLDACVDCRREYEAFAAMIAALRDTPPPVAEPHWGRWRAELRHKLDARARRRGRWWLRPLPLGLSAAVAAGLLVFVVHTALERPPRDLASVEETVLGGQLDLLRQYSIVERLDLLENLELIRQLDGLAPQRDS